MKKPRFGILLTLAQTQEDEARLALGRATVRVQECLTRIDDLTLTRNEEETGGIAWRDVWSAWRLRVDGQIAVERRLLAQCEAECDKARTVLADAHRQVLTWERLRERDTDAINEAAERKAARELDDLGLRAHGAT